jgi:hypothetical protein
VERRRAGGQYPVGARWHRLAPGTRRHVPRPKLDPDRIGEANPGVPGLQRWTEFMVRVRVRVGVATKGAGPSALDGIHGQGEG